MTRTVEAGRGLAHVAELTRIPINTLEMGKACHKEDDKSSFEDCQKEMKMPNGARSLSLSRPKPLGGFRVCLVVLCMLMPGCFASNTSGHGNLDALNPSPTGSSSCIRVNASMADGWQFDGPDGFLPRVPHGTLLANTSVAEGIPSVNLTKSVLFSSSFVGVSIFEDCLAEIGLSVGLPTCLISSVFPFLAQLGLGVLFLTRRVSPCGPRQVVVPRKRRKRPKLRRSLANRRKPPFRSVLPRFVGRRRTRFARMIVRDKAFWLRVRRLSFRCIPSGLPLSGSLSGCRPSRGGQAVSQGLVSSSPGSPPISAWSHLVTWWMVVCKWFSHIGHDPYCGCRVGEASHPGPYGYRRSARTRRQRAATGVNA